MGCTPSQVDAKYQFVVDPAPRPQRVSWIATAGAQPSRSSVRAVVPGSSASAALAPRGSVTGSGRRGRASGGGGGGSKVQVLRRGGGRGRGSLRTSSVRNVRVRGGRADTARRRSLDGTVSRITVAKRGSTASDGGGSGKGRRAAAGGAALRVTDSTPPTELQLQGLLGRGTLGRVFLAKHKVTNLYYAVKRISKTEVCRRKNIKGVLAEIDTLRACKHPFIVNMHACLQDDKFIYIVLDYAVGGELYTRMGQPFSEDAVRFYMCEIFLGLRYLHREQLTAFRDLKPENVLIGQDGHLLLVDFGFAVKLDDADHEVPKACGTTQYMAPELIQKKRRHGMPVDWWAAGCIMYELLTGKAPFGDIGDKSKWEIYAKVAKGGKIKFPGFVSQPARDLISQLLALDPAKRAKWEQVKASAWLRGVDWDAVLAKKVSPPFVPSIGPTGDRACYPERPAKKDKPEVPLSRDQLAYCDITQPRVAM